MLIRTHSGDDHAGDLARLGESSARMSAGDSDAAYEYFADSFMRHASERINPSAVGTDIRPEEYRFWESAKTAFPDMEVRVDLLIQADGLVVSHWTLPGTYTGGDYYDVPRSGDRVTINGTAILRMKDGQVVEHWGGPH